MRIASDGVLEYEELQMLTVWLNDHSKSEVPAIRLMFDLLIRVCGDEKITDEENKEYQT